MGTDYVGKVSGKPKWAKGKVRKSKTTTSKKKIEKKTGSADDSNKVIESKKQEPGSRRQRFAKIGVCRRT